MDNNRAQSEQVMWDNLYLIEVSGWRGFRFMKIRDANEDLARAVASRKIWPKRGEYIKNVTQERA